MAKAQIAILEGRASLEDYPEGDWVEVDEDNEIYRSAEEADEWLNGDRDEDLFG